MFSKWVSKFRESADVQSPLSEVVFNINGKSYTAKADSVPVDTSLNSFIRNYAHLSGTKFMCLEGGCGACTVNVSGVHPVTKETRTWSVNSCLFPVFACHGMDIKTVEALGNRYDGYHPIQERLAHLNGSQCGYCSPGMVMTMYSLLESKKGSVSMQEVEDALGGNICRCTGYRPILDAFKSLATDVEKGELLDIEELRICPKSNTACSGKCPAAACEIDPGRPLRIEFQDDREWHRVYTVYEIFFIFGTILSKPYMLVGGNTAHGVYRRNESIKIFVDINHVEELRSHYTFGNWLTVGANVPLAEFIEILLKTAQKKPGFFYCRQLANHLNLVANPAVRNSGTIAGNLITKQQYHDFPSDVFLLLEAVGAKLTIVESLIFSYQRSPSEFIQMDMNKKLIKNIALPMLPKETNVFRSYKITPRAQNAHAYVNAAFLLQFNSGKQTLSSATICFGGINPQFVHAARTEQFLVGKKLFDNDTIQQAVNTLATEIKPNWILPDTSPEYRKNLAIGLFYKCILSVAADESVAISPRYSTGGFMLERSLSSGQQHFETNEKNWPVSQNVPKLEGMMQVSGEAKYTNDFPPFPGELYAAYAVATKVNSTVGRIDPSDALKHPGVVAFFSAKDIPGKNNFGVDGLIFPFPDVEEILCSGRVLFHGQPVGVIVADRFDQAMRAAKLVKILYERTSDDPIYPTAKSWMDKQRKKPLEDRRITADQGTDDGALRNGAKHIAGTLELGSQYHYTMETQTCVCVPTEDGMDIYCATQWIDECQVAVAAALNVPENSLNFTVRRLGGSYGAKLTRASQIACACALAAQLTRRPVRFVLNIETNMESIGKRYGCISNYLITVDANGKIEQLSNNFIQDAGSSRNDDLLAFTLEAFRISYNSGAWKTKGENLLTDVASNTWARAPGTTEGSAMVETMMEHIAWATGVDPMHVRLGNMPQDSPLQQMMPQFRLDVEFDKRKRQVDEFNANNRWHKRGIAMAPMQFPLIYLGQLRALVSIYAQDGTVSIVHGGIEMGQGINTKAAQVAAHILGIPLTKVTVKATRDFVSPNSMMTGGSMTSDAVGYAVKRACEILNERLQPVKDEFKNAPWEQITRTSYLRNIDLSASVQFKSSDGKPYSIWGVSCAEIETDLLTGTIQLIRVDILEDTGESLSPGIDVGQVEGAFIMGVGYWLMESLVYDMTTGALLTNRTWNYKPPGAKDIPVDFRIKLTQTRDNAAGVLRSKGTGEPATTASIVVLFALRYALRSAQKDAGRPDDWIPLGSATTPEQIFLKASNTIDQFKLY